MQEVLHLSVTIGSIDHVKVEDFLMNDDQIVFITRAYTTLKVALTQSYADLLNADKLIKDVAAEMDILYNNLERNGLLLDP